MLLLQRLEHADGAKLSKQTHAAALPLPADSALVRLALSHLCQNPPDEHLSCHEWLAWGIAHWQPECIRPDSRLSPDTFPANRDPAH